MSLEAAIAGLTEALKENSDLLKNLTSKAKAGVEAKTSAAAADDAGEEKKEGRRGRPAKEKVPTTTDLKSAAEKFLDVADADEYAERKDGLKKIVAKHGGSKFSELPEGVRVAALKDLEELSKDFEDRGAAEDDDPV